MNRFTLLGILSLLFSCNDTTDERNGSDAANEPYFNPDFEYVHMIPDSMRTAEQNEFLQRLQQVIDEHLQSENNELVFPLSREAFVAMGFPEAYYVLIQKDLENNNKFFKENGLDVDSLLEQAQSRE